jgi:L-ascorbate metabolism protein UlaG (beta-lactamase superfamily)
MKPCQKVEFALGGKIFHITATPCDHIPGGECTGFILATDSFGSAADGRPNAIYLTGDTVYVPELARVAEDYHVAAALMNLGEARAQIQAPPAPKR